MTHPKRISRNGSWMVGIVILIAVLAILPIGVVLRQFAAQLAEDLRKMRPVNYRLLTSLAFSPDGKSLALGWRSIESRRLAGGQIKLIALQPPGFIRTLTRHCPDVGWMHFSPDGQILACGGLDSKVALWRVGTGQLVRLLKLPSDQAQSAVFSPDGQVLAVGSGAPYEMQGKWTLWNVRTGLMERMQFSHSRGVMAISFSPDGTLLASGSVGAVKLWNVGSGALHRVLTGHADPVLVLHFSPDNTRLASASYQQLMVHEVRTGRLLWACAFHSNILNHMAFSPDFRQVASAHDDATIQLRDIRSGRLLQTLAGHQDAVLSVVFSPDGKKLASCGYDTTVRLWDVKLWDVETGRLLRTYRSVLSDG